MHPEVKLKQNRCRRWRPFIPSETVWWPIVWFATNRWYNNCHVNQEIRNLKEPSSSDHYLQCCRWRILSKSSHLKVCCLRLSQLKCQISSSLMISNAVNLVSLHKAHEIGFDSWEDKEQLDTQTSNQVSSVDVAKTSVQQQFMTTLKKDCPTRWNCLLFMVAIICWLINNLLSGVLFAYECLMKCVATMHVKRLRVWWVLKIFKTATQVLSSSKYPTCVAMLS